jgi:hypothetical protein
MTLLMQNHFFKNGLYAARAMPLSATPKVMNCQSGRHKSASQARQNSFHKSVTKHRAPQRGCRTFFVVHGSDS